MQKRSKINYSIIGGLVLVTTGVLLLLSNFKVIRTDWRLIVSPIIALGGVGFLAVFLSDRRHWWTLIPAMVLIAIGAVIALENLDINLNNRFEALVLFGLVGLAFWLIYINDHKHWWAIIPGGVLWSFGAASFIGEGALGNDFIFFFGLGLTFFLVYLLPNPFKKMKWALIPAGIFAGIGIIVSLTSGGWLSYISPAMLVIAGIALLIFALGKK